VETVEFFNMVSQKKPPPFLQGRALRVRKYFEKDLTNRGKTCIIKAREIPMTVDFLVRLG